MSVLLGFHWILEGIANTLVLLVIARLFAFGYREHSYLYQFEDRTKALDTWIEFLVPYAKLLRLSRYRGRITLSLSRSGTRRNWDSNHFIASQILMLGISSILSFVLLGLILRMPFYVTSFVPILATLFPYLRLSDIASVRHAACNRDLSFFVDYLGLAMTAGLDFNHALQTVVKDAPKSPLVDEFAGVLRNMRLGMSRAEALYEMDRRLSSPPIKLFVQTLVQGMELGTDIVQSLSAMSDIMQQRRFQAAEEKAGKISVKMMIPMTCFVMPAIMIVLLGPMILTYVKTG